MMPPPWLANMEKKRLVIFSFSAVLFLSAVILVVSILAGARSGAKTSPSSAASLEATRRGGALAGELLFPGINPYEPEFPFVRERKSRYTFEDIKKLLPDPASIDVDALRKKRKERLETLYSTID